MNILLTGSSGFIGSRFIPEYKTTYNIQTFSLLKDRVEEFDFSKIDTVVHLAALVHQMSGAQESEYERVNVAYTIDLAKKAKEIFFSSEFTI